MFSGYLLRSLIYEIMIIVKFSYTLTFIAMNLYIVKIFIRIEIS